MNFAIAYQKVFVFCCMAINTMVILRMVNLDFASLAVIISLLLTNSVHELLTRNHKNWRLLYFVLTALVLITSQQELVQQELIAEIPLKRSEVKMLDIDFCYPENRTVEIENVQKSFSSTEQCEISASKADEQLNPWKIYAECAAGLVIGAIALLGKF
jgi:hypothetical protein